LDSSDKTYTIIQHHRKKLIKRCDHRHTGRPSKFIYWVRLLSACLQVTRSVVIIEDLLVKLIN